MKLRERVGLGIGGAAVLFTLGLILDLQLDLGVSGAAGPRKALQVHGRARVGSDSDPPRVAYNSFRRKFLNATGGGGGSGAARTLPASTLPPHDDFADLAEVLNDLPSAQEVVVKTYEEDEDNPTLGLIYNVKLK